MVVSGEQLQKLLDAGYSVNKCATILGEHHEKLRRFIRKHSLEIYVAFDESEEIRFTINYSDIESLVYIDELFKVRVDKEKRDYLQHFGNWSFFHTRWLNEIKDEFKKDAIELWVSSMDLSMVDAKMINSFGHIDFYIRKVYGTYDRFRKIYDIDCKMLDSYDKERNDVSRREGFEFERLVASVLNEIMGDSVTNHKMAAEGCIPDFVVGDHWFDAKRSRSTALGYNCETIEKYRKHTDYLTIIYALHDTEEHDDRANFLCITEFYPHISDELRRKCNEFIAKASETNRRAQAS